MELKLAVSFVPEVSYTKLIVPVTFVSFIVTCDCPTELREVVILGAESETTGVGAVAVTVTEAGAPVPTLFVQVTV